MNLLANILRSLGFSLRPYSYCRQPVRVRARRGRRGLTLIELMIAVALTLLIIAAMVRAFKLTSDEISLGRARMDMHTKMRVVTETLRRDLQQATCLPRPRGLNDERSGFLEYIEGEETDNEHTLADQNSHVGDHDDILGLTVRSDDKPFKGRFNGNIIESNLAEIWWWMVHDDTNGDGELNYDENIRLYRRVLLIRPDLTTVETDFTTFFESNDVSVQREPGGTALIMNSLEDLANRRNRFAHNTSTFPHEIIPALLVVRQQAGDFEGEDLMMSDAVGFDIKVLDPRMEVFRPAAADFTVTPNPDIGQPIDFNDAGFTTIATNYPIGTFPNSWPQVGGYVDLGYDPANTFGNTDRWFANISANVAGYTFANFPRTYCTWWAGYESDGIDQDGDGLFDEGANGVDDDGANGIDDNLERETVPPYAHPIRSIQISLRMIEKRTNQVLQSTVKESFVPN